jgi:hypothetical protein
MAYATAGANEVLLVIIILNLITPSIRQTQERQHPINDESATERIFDYF